MERQRDVGREARCVTKSKNPSDNGANPSVPHSSSLSVPCHLSTGVTELQMESHFRKVGEKSGRERMQSEEMENKRFQRHGDAWELQIERRMKERIV